MKIAGLALKALPVSSGLQETPADEWASGGHCRGPPDALAVSRFVMCGFRRSGPESALMLRVADAYAMWGAPQMLHRLGPKVTVHLRADRCH